jgi:hypothetical protein
MASVYEQRNLSMTPDLWAALEALAVQTNSRSTRGPQARQHSWRTMIERIAAGEIALTERAPYVIPPALDEAIAANEQQQERVVQHRQRIAEHKPAERKQPLKLTQLQMELEPA